MAVAVLILLPALHGQQSISGPDSDSSQPASKPLSTDVDVPTLPAGTHMVGWMWW
jgi:hypothetical protein